MTRFPVSKRGRMPRHFRDLQAENQRLKEAIEEAWDDAGLPTFLRYLRDYIKSRADDSSGCEIESAISPIAGFAGLTPPCDHRPVPAGPTAVATVGPSNSVPIFFSSFRPPAGLCSTCGNWPSFSEVEYNRRTR